MCIRFPAAMIRYERLGKNWSQEGLCDGVCAVSYLSKIEQGKAEPSPEILRGLMERLGVEWADNPRSKALVQEMEEALFSLDHEAKDRLLAEVNAQRASLLHGPHMLDLLLLLRLLGEESEPEIPLSAFRDCFTPHQCALWLLGEGRPEDALALLPNAYVWLESGAQLYRQGQYALAVERLMRAASLAAEEGRARVMLHARALLGNCHSDQFDLSAMLAHYQAATRLANALGETEMVADIRYNIAATRLALGQVEEAYAHFASVEHPCAMDLHKLAVCLEKLDRKEEALRAIRRAEQAEQDYPNARTDMPSHEWTLRMCALVRYRLEHPAYLKDAAYGERLLDTFQRMREELPHGFVLFHLPWVEEWYTASRQYKQAYELRKQFS